MRLFWREKLEDASMKNLRIFGQHTLQDGSYDSDPMRTEDGVTRKLGGFAERASVEKWMDRGCGGRRL